MLRCPCPPTVGPFAPSLPVLFFEGRTFNSASYAEKISVASCPVSQRACGHVFFTGSSAFPVSSPLRWDNIKSLYRFHLSKILQSLKMFNENSDVDKLFCRKANHERENLTGLA